MYGSLLQLVGCLVQTVVAFFALLLAATYSASVIPCPVSENTTGLQVLFEYQDP